MGLIQPLSPCDGRRGQQRPGRGVRETARRYGYSLGLARTGPGELSMLH